MWEYLKKEIEFNIDYELINILNKDGKDGWEAVSYDETIKTEKYGIKHYAIVLYKRPLKQIQHE
jgi:hypothetical protein